MTSLSEMRKRLNRGVSLFSGNSLGFRLVGTFIFIIVVVLTAYTVYSVIHEQREERKNLEKKGRVLVDLLSYSSRLGVFAENREQLMDVAAGFVSEPDVILVGIYNAERKPLYVSNEAPSGMGISAEIEGRKAGIRREGRKISVRDTGRTMEFLKPVILKMFPNEERSLYFGANEGEGTDRVIGHVRIVFSQETLKQEILAILGRNVIVALVFIAFSIVLVYLRVRKITKPLETLTHNVKALGEGGEVAYAPVETMDEIGRLATAFNTMLDERRVGRAAFQKILMEIHDGIGGITTNISLLSEVARKAKSAEDVSKALAMISSLSDEGRAEIRNLMYSLDQKDMSWQTLCSELRNQGNRTLEPHGIAFEWTTSIEPDSPHPVSLLCLHLFKVYREALTNIIKHSRAKNVKAGLRVEKGSVILTVQDDGQGCGEAALRGNGRGVPNIKARAADIGGSAMVTGESGTRIVVEIPILNKALLLQNRTII